MVFELNMTALWVMALLILLVFLKVAIKLIFVLTGRDDEPFDIRRLPEFLATDILPEIGGLMILSIVMFIQPTEALPEAFAGILLALQALWLAAAFALAGKYLAKISDRFPKTPPAVPQPVEPPADTVPPDPGLTQPTNPPVPG